MTNRSTIPFKTLFRPILLHLVRSYHQLGLLHPSREIGRRYEKIQEAYRQAWNEMVDKIGDHVPDFDTMLEDQDLNQERLFGLMQDVLDAEHLLIIEEMTGHSCQHQPG